MKRIVYLISFLGILLSSKIALAEAKFKIEIQNYTDAELKFYCKSITGSQKWLFPQGKIIVPARTSVTEDVEIARSLQQTQEEIQCYYSGQGSISSGMAFDNQGLPVRVLEKTTHSVAISSSFGGLLRLVVNPTISKKLSH